MAKMKLKAKHKLWEPAEQYVQIFEDNSSVLRFSKEEPEEVEIKAEPQEFPLIRVCVKSEEEEPESSLLHQTVKEETREDAGERLEKHPESEGHGENSSGPHVFEAWTRVAEKPTPQTHSEVKEPPLAPAQRKPADKKNAGTSAKNCTCSHCGETFTTITKLKVHERIHTGEKPFKCSVCEKRFPLKHRLNDHMKTHTGEKPFKCSICGMCFTWMSRLKTHMKSHTGARSFRCPVCSDFFLRNCLLQQHMKIHLGEKLF